MTMLGACIRKEILCHVASVRFWVATLITVVLAGGATLVAARDYESRRERHEDRLAAQQRELRKVSVYSFLQPVVLRPPEPLSVLDQGFDARLGTEVRVHLFGIPTHATGGSRGNELLAGLPAAEVDLTTIVSVILGLLALLLACDAITCEREENTLRTLLAQGVSRRVVLAGKTLGGLLTLCLALTAALGVSFAVLTFTVGWEPYAGRGLRIAGLVASYLIYLALMFLLGLLISLRARSSARALVVAVLFWLVTVVVLPQVAWTVAASLVDTQEAASRTEARSRQLAEEERRRLGAAFVRHPLRRGLSGHTAISYTAGAYGGVRYRNGSAAYYDALREYYGFEVRSGLRQAEQSYAARRRYEERLRQAERLGLWLTAASPAVLLDRLSESFTGTSFEDHDAFLAESRRYRKALLAFLERHGAFRSWRWFTDDPPDGLHPWPRFLGLRPEEVDAARVHLLFNRLSSGEIQPKLQLQRSAAEADPSRRLDLAGLPRFAYRGPELGDCLRRAAPEGLFLLLLVSVTSAAAWSRFARYPVR